MSASAYTRGGTLYNSLEARYGTAKAEQAWRDAIAAEKSGVNVDGAWRANEDYKLAGKTTEQLDSSFWDTLGTQAGNGILQAPIETVSRQFNNAIDSAGKAAKSAVSKAAGNWGVWIIGGVLVVVAFIYFGGSNFIRSRIKNLK